MKKLNLVIAAAFLVSTVAFAQQTATSAKQEPAKTEKKDDKKGTKKGTKKGGDSKKKTDTKAAK
jgi:hypothetical protein